MNWHDEAIILGTRQHGETSLIVEVMSLQHGRHLGIVKRGRSRRFAAALQPGNRISVEWWARLDEHLGSFKIEVIDFTSSRLMATSQSLFSFQTIAAHLRLLPEREIHEALYQMTNLLIDHCDDFLASCEIMVRLELRLLDDLGFGLDLQSCAATGNRDSLIYVSPKSARAVCRSAGEPWKDKLLVLPTFLLLANKRPLCIDELLSGFTLTRFFLERHVFEPRGIQIPTERDSILRLLKKQLLAEDILSKAS